MDRSEIEKIAKLAAQETLIRVNRYTREYQEPETVEIGLAESMQEELTAGDWYRRRAINARLMHTDEETAKLYEHLAGEEDGHYTELTKRFADIRSWDLKRLNEFLQTSDGAEPAMLGKTSSGRLSHYLRKEDAQNLITALEMAILQVKGRIKEIQDTGKSLPFEPTIEAYQNNIKKYQKLLGELEDIYERKL